MVGILNAAKNIISGKSPFDEPAKMPDNRLDRVDQCKVIWYQWKNELGTGPSTFGIGPVPPPTPTSQLSASRSYDISNHIENFTYTKGMSNGAGSFSFTMHNSFDWPRWMRPGQWVCIFLNKDGELPLPKEPKANSTAGVLSGAGSLAALATGALGSFGSITGLFNPTAALPLPPGPPATAVQTWKKNLRCMGVIQRVGIRSNTSADGAVETSFTISGKDFGVVFEETELWFNASNADGLAFSQIVHGVAQQFTRNLTEAMNKWYDIFLNPNNELATSVTSIKSFFPVQWVLPDQMVTDFDLKIPSSGQGTFGEIAGVKEFNATVFENVDPFPFNGLKGTCWERLKSLSESPFHELFTELSDAGNPKLIYRPVPWKMDDSKYPTIGALMMGYKDMTTSSSVPPLLSLGTNVAQFSSLKALTSALGQGSGASLPSDARTQHTVPISAVEVESYDLGPDYHSRANFFLVQHSKSSELQQNSFAQMSKDYSVTWPLRDEADIKRHGFRPQFMDTNAIIITSKNLFGVNPDIAFIKEVNFMMKDLWSNAEDFYSGSMTLAGGRGDVKLGKVIITDDSFQGIGEMAFYIEGYSDSFVTTGDGCGVWTQTLNLTRGMQKTVLAGGSSKDKQSTEPETFHADQKSDSDGGTLGKIKAGIKDPTSLF